MWCGKNAHAQQVNSEQVLFSVPSPIVLQRLLCFMLCHSDWAWERGGGGGGRGQREKGYRGKEYLRMYSMRSPPLTRGRKQIKGKSS